jgi:predicted metal-dependent phosphoesterase TrpH
MSAAIDLHIHSHASDGEASAGHIADVARQRHMRLVAIADHDEGRESMRLAESASDRSRSGRTAIWG